MKSNEFDITIDLNRVSKIELIKHLSKAQKKGFSTGILLLKDLALNEIDKGDKEQGLSLIDFLDVLSYHLDISIKIDNGIGTITTKK